MTPSRLPDHEPVPHQDRDPLHVTVWDEATPGAPRAVLVHGTMSWGTRCFAAQRPLAASFRLELVDRRGFGDSPATTRSDYAVDAEDVGRLVGRGAHLDCCVQFAPRCANGRCGTPGSPSGRRPRRSCPRSW
ncbi:alpha/beta fold hydrolase [Streptomyces sp. NPDC048638]|uniref:alpha/beta fold hydrolase n=1 Tax=Streptomyces sp. NPDC048638 TaxID=3365580 RepID=UPI00371B36B7